MYSRASYEPRVREARRAIAPIHEDTRKYLGLRIDTRTQRHMARLTDHASIDATNHLRYDVEDSVNGDLEIPWNIPSRS